MDKQHKLFDFEVKGGDANKRQIEAIASAPSIDRDGEIISIEALKAALPGYLRNPVILASHVHKTDTGNSSVVGKCVAARVDSAGLHITVEFAKTALGEEYLGLYKDKHQRAFSIGFMPIRYEDRQIKGNLVRVFTEVELLEISCVAVPSNRDALSKSAKRKAGFVGRKRQTAWDVLNGPGSRRWCKRWELWSDLRDDPDQQKKIFTAAEQAEFNEMWRKAGEDNDYMNAMPFSEAEIRENKRLDEAEARYAAKLGKEVDDPEVARMVLALDLDEGIGEIGDLDDIDDLLWGGKQYDFAAIVRGKKK
jgi:HK97 family phage prohead protease